MPDIALIVAPGATPSSVATTLDIFNVANGFPADEPCRVALLSAADGGDVQLSDALRIETQPLPERLQDFDAVMVPGFFAVEISTLLDQLRTRWQPVVASLKTVRAPTLVAASCYGTFVLAESGLLDGHRATTSWWFREDFARRYPRVTLDADRALIDDGPFITAGAMTAHTELAMAVLRRLKGDELARSVASIMLVGEGKSSQRPYMAVQRHFPDPLAQEVANHLISRFDQALSSEGLVAACHASYRTLHRRFRAASGMSPQEYLQALRIEQAKALLASSAMSMDSIVEKVGYGDTPSFRRLFARRVGLTPSEYRRRFRRGQ